MALSDTLRRLADEVEELEANLLDAEEYADQLEDELDEAKENIRELETMDQDTLAGEQE